MKKRIVILLLVLIMSVLILPVTGYAESYGGEEIYVSFERAEAENISYAFPKNQSLKSVDVFVGETLDITTALKTPFSADPTANILSSTLRKAAEYRSRKSRRPCPRLPIAE